MIDDQQNSKVVKVLLSCTGVGVISRGIETFARECFDGLRHTPGLHIVLYKGLGADALPDERRLWCLPRTGLPARLIGRIIRRDGYVVEQLSSFFPLARRIRLEQPDVIFTSDGNLARWLYVFRSKIGVPFKLLFSNGGPVGPRFPYMDHVQQVTPFYRDEALVAGEPPEKLSLVPYGIHVPDGDPVALSAEERRLERGRLGLPMDGRRIVLSVGAVTTRDHKRMEYTIDEVAALPAGLKRPFLVLLGFQDESSAPLLTRARDKLGMEGFVARSVPYFAVTDYYRVADVFMLASLREGFGRVYLEALSAGLPLVVHDHPLMHYVVGPEGTFGDLSVPGNGARLLNETFLRASRPEDGARRRQSVRERFSWTIIAPAYLEMFRRCVDRRP